MGARVEIYLYAFGEHAIWGGAKAFHHAERDVHHKKVAANHSRGV
jgi:hypothetical protein